MAAEDRSLNRSDAAVFALMVLVGIGVTGAAIAWPDPIGWWEDDGVYLVTAKAMAEGRGYRHLHLPGEPWQTKYPPLYPSVLALIWRAWPQFPENLLLVRALNGAMAVGAAWLAYLLARRAFDVARWVAALAAILALVNFYWQALIGSAMSEHLYALLCFAALYAGSRFEFDTAEVVPARSSARSLLRAVLLGLLVSAAALTRTVGVALVAAVMLSLVRSKRWTPLAVSASIVALVASAQGTWLATARQSNASIAESSALAYDLEYSAWQPRDTGSLAWVAWHNAGEIPFTLFKMIASPPPALATWATSGGRLHAAPLLAVLAAIVFLIATGMAVTWRRGREAAHLLVLFSIALMLTWPFPPSRFLAPLLPLLLLWLLAGASRTADAAATIVLGHARAHGRDLGTAGAVAAAMVGVLIALRSVGSSLSAPGSESARSLERDRAACAEMLRRRTPPSAIIAAPHGPYYHLITGRSFVPLFPAVDPVSEFYPPDRSWLTLGAGDTTQRHMRFKHVLEALLVDYYRDSGASHLCLPESRSGRPATIRDFVSAQPGLFRDIARVGTFRLVGIAARK